MTMNKHIIRYLSLSHTRCFLKLAVRCFSGILFAVVTLSLIAFVLLAGNVYAADPHSKTNAHESSQSAAEEKEKEKPDHEKDKVSQTSHTITLNGKELHYSATAGELTITHPDGDTTGRLFYIAYEIEEIKNKSERPLTFIFNGGPGAASVWLHLGGLGPVRIELSEDGRALPPPVKYAPNPYTWLAFTDLVFVDPVGTGFSRAKPDNEEQSSKFYGVQEDIKAVAEFIRLYLTRTSRWTSPKFLAGESYGTTRVAALSQHLHQRFGIDLNGVILISPVLDYDTILFHPSHDLPYVLFLPSYAATAHFHGMTSKSHNSNARETIIKDAEEFTLGTYLMLLAKGESLTEEEKLLLLNKLRNLTGLPVELIERNNFRVDWAEFTKNLLKGKKKIVGRMDGSITGADLNPADSHITYDPSLDTLFGPFSSAMNAYVREDLKFERDLFYEILNSEVNMKWDWSSGLRHRQGFLDVSHTLRDAMVVNPSLKVFIASGVYDLATPYFATDYTVRHMWLGQFRSNITMKRYLAGHMIFTHREELEKLTRDVSNFYRSALKH